MKWKDSSETHWQEGEWGTGSYIVVGHPAPVLELCMQRVRVGAKHHPSVTRSSRGPGLSSRRRAAPCSGRRSRRRPPGLRTWEPEWFRIPGPGSRQARQAAASTGTERGDSKSEPHRGPQAAASGRLGLAGCG